MLYSSSRIRSLLVAGLIVGVMALAGVSPAFAQSCDVFVDTNASGGGDGSQGSPYTNLQDGLDDAASGQAVCVAEGTYNPPKKNTPFSMTGGSTLRGGYPSGFSSTTQDVDGNPTVLDGANVQQGGATAKRVLTLGSFSGTTVIDGVTIKNGDGNAGAGFAPGGYFNDTLTFRDVVFDSNNAGNNNGGAIRFDGEGTLQLIGVEFRNNKGGKGGALFAKPSSFTLTIDNSVFVGNEATKNGGGAIKTEGGTIEMENVLLSGNLAAANGGGFYFDYPDGGSLVNVTITGNQAQSAGGGFYVGTNNQITFDNSIIWNNAASSGADQVGIDYGGSNLLYRYSDIQGSGGSGAWDTSYGTDGGNNIALNPIFLTPKQPSAAPTTAGDYRLGSRSPALDAGDNGAVTLSNDLDGENRIQDGTVDMGPYEGSAPLPDPEILYVDKNSGSDSNGGTSWSDAVATLQAALSQASSNTEIWVADGVYYPDESPGGDSDDPAASFDLNDRVSIYGGFAGNESSRSERDPDANLVVLSGDLTQDDNTNGNGVVTSPSDQNNGSNNNPTNAYHVVNGSGVSSQTVLDGVTITAGSADDKKNKDERPDEVGGGVFINNGSPTLSDVRIIGNRAKLDGGGIASYGGGGPVISESVIESNNSARNGGGIYNADGSGLRVRFVTLRGNRATEKGGGIYNSGSNVRMTNVTIDGNEATSGTSRGGGIATLDSKGSVLTNLRVVGNRAAAGGGFYNHDDNTPRSTTTIGTSTFSGNYATNGTYPRGGAIFTKNEPIKFQNSIAWGNGPNQIEDETSFTQNASLIDGGLDGALNQDPKFISDPTLASSDTSTDGNLQLQPTSPAVDAGDETLLPADVSDVDDDGDTGEQLPYDLAGGTRVRDGQVDIGAYEGTSTTLTVEGTYGADGTDKGWRDFGVPKQGVTVADVERSNGTGLKTLAKWGGFKYLNGSWTSITSSEALATGRGVSVYFTDKNQSALDPSLTLVTTTGSIIGNQDVTVGDGSSGDPALDQNATFHFLANPYGVPYDLSELNDSAPNFQDFQTTVQIWDVEDGYKTIDLSRPFSEKTGIVTWQAFFIERMSPGSGAEQLTFPSGGRLPSDSNTNPYFGSKSKEGDSKSSLLKFKISAETEEGTQLLQDEAANVLISANASEGWDRYDATKLTPPTNKFAVIGPIGHGREGELKMKAQESLGFPPTNKLKVPLGLKVKGYSGPLSVSLERLANVPEEWTVTLVDTKGTADRSDDAEQVLQKGGTGYRLVYGASKKSGAKKVTASAEPVKQVRPPHPDPIEWRGPAARKKSKKSKASERSQARFLVKISMGGALPVEMAGFDATLDGKRAQLRWETASESQNTGFYVQHQRLSDEDSTTSVGKWSSLGFREGAGSSDEPNQYQYETDPMEYGRHAFRLRQVDTDGTARYTDPIIVEVKLDRAVALRGPYPNPVRGTAKLDLTVGQSQKVTVRMYDVLGRRVQTITKKKLEAGQTETVRMETNRLSSGTYFLRVAGDKFQKTRRMSVTR